MAEMILLEAKDWRRKEVSRMLAEAETEEALGAD